MASQSGGAGRAVASGVLRQVTGPHCVLTTPEILELPSIEIKLIATNSE